MSNFIYTLLFYPYDDLNLDFDKRRAAILYDILCFPYVLLSNPSWKKWIVNQLNSFLKGFTVITIDCSRQNESVKNDTMDVRLEFEFKENVPANTTVYCLIIHDPVIENSLRSTQDYVNYRFRERVILSPVFSRYKR